MPLGRRTKTFGCHTDASGGVLPLALVLGPLLLVVVGEDGLDLGLVLLVLQLAQLVLQFVPLRPDLVQQAAEFTDGVDRLEVTLSQVVHLL